MTVKHGPYIGRIEIKLKGIVEKKAYYIFVLDHHSFRHTRCTRCVNHIAEITGSDFDTTRWLKNWYIFDKDPLNAGGYYLFELLSCYHHTCGAVFQQKFNTLGGQIGFDGEITA